MKKYIGPSVTLLLFKSEDVITASDILNTGMVTFAQDDNGNFGDFNQIM